MSQMLSRIADSWTRAWGQGDTEAFQRLVAGDYVRHSKAGEQVRLPAMIRQIEDSHAAFTDFRVEIVHAVENDDLVAIHWRSVGIHTGTFMGVPPTQRTVTVHGASFLRHQDGLVREEWVVWDPREFLSAMQIWHLGDHSRQAS